MDELMRLDKKFNQEMFISKANNIFVMLHTAIMLDDIDMVSHFISDEVRQKYQQELIGLKQKNLKKMYDELNVKTTSIKNISINGEIATIDVEIISRYMEYLIHKETGEFVRGNNKSRVEKTNNLIFRKNITSNYEGVLRKCPACGASIDINANGKCNYCKTIFNAEDHDWILISMETTE